MSGLLWLSLLLATAPRPALADQIAVARAAEWMAGYAQEQPLNFDAVIVLALLRQRFETAALALAFERANARLDRDRGHPLRRFFEPQFRLPAELSRGWTPPEGAAARLNPDRVVTEALHCADNGWRAETTAYVCGPMRDDGGYYTAHGLWALTLARGAGCVAPAQVDPCIADLRRELARAQPVLFVPWGTLDIDLFAERAVMLLLSGGLPPSARGGPAQLRDLQNGDGSWGLGLPEEPPYLRFHATMMASWALLADAAMP